MGAGLHGETPEEIERIQAEAIGTNGTNGTQGPGEVATAPQGTGSKTKRRDREKMTSNVWQHFVKGKRMPDKSYTATCLYCKHVYMMGNSRGTGSMKNHVKRGCKKMPRSKRHKSDALQKLLKAGNAPGLIFNYFNYLLI